MAVGAIAICSGLGAVAAGTHPTAAGPSDVVLALGLGAVMVIASSVAAPAAWLAAALLVTALSGAWIGATTLAVAVSLVAVSFPMLPGRRVAGALIGAALVQTLLRLPPDRLGLNAALSGVVICFLIAAGWPALSARTRTRVRWVSVRLAALTGMVLAGFSLAVLLARNDIRGGIGSAEAGLEAARDGESDDAADLLDGARSSFESAHADLGAWWAKPALLLPVVGQHARALSAVTETGADLAGAAASSARAARVEDLQMTDGKLDLDHVRSMAAPLKSVQSALATAEGALADIRSAWLVPPVVDRLDQLERTVESATTEAALAAEAVAVLPDLLGGSGPRRYFVAFGTPAETRELGGFMGAYATLLADDGEITLEATGRVRDINEALRGRKLTDKSVFPAHYLAFQPQRYWQNVTATADFPTVAEAVRQMWTQRAGSLDGVLYMDPQTLADMLHLTGPIRVPGHDEPLTAETAAPFLLREQYIEYPEDDRHDFLVDAAETVFDELTSGDLPRPGVIAQTLSPAVHERRLILNSFHPAEQHLFESFRLDGALPPVRGDFLSVRSSNRGLSKIDAMMQRTLDYSITVDPSSDRVRATLTVAIRNDAPASGLPDAVIGNRVGQPEGTNSTTVSVYTPLELIDVLEGGRSVARGAFEEYGRNKYTALVDVRAGRTVTLTFELEGKVDLRNGYHLDVVPQPLVNADRLRITVNGPSGWQRRGDEAPFTKLRETVQIAVPAISRSRETR